MPTLKSTTSDAWAGAILGDLAIFLADHALCERKASAMALSLISRSPEYPQIHETLADLAVEELDHYRQVLAHLHSRGFPSSIDRKDDYAVQLRKLVRTGPREDSFVDLLLVAALIEARSLERLKLAASALADVDPDLAQWYRGLARAEARHAELFVQLAKQVAPTANIDARLEELLTDEAQIVDNLPITAHVH